MISIDGSELEGGGQILRVSMALSCLLKKPISITAIRASRPKPGLAAQHLAGVRLVQAISGDSTLVGAELGSVELSFQPGDRLREESFRVDCGTAGSVTLMVQSALPCLALTSPSFLHRMHSRDNGDESKVVTLKLMGGTNVSASPPIDHLKHVLLPLLERHCGVRASVTIHRRGYYPRGGGSVQLSMTPVSSIRPISLESQGSLLNLCAVVYGNADPPLLRELEQSLYRAFRVKPLVAKDGSSLSEIEVYDSDSSEALTDHKSASQPVQSRRQQEEHDRKSHHQKSNQHHQSGRGGASRAQGRVVSGLGCQLWAHTSSGAILSANAFVDSKTLGRDLSSSSVEHLAAQVSSELRALALSGACVDEYTADQLVLFMALAGGSSVLLVEPANERSSLHIVTAIKMATDLSAAQFLFEEVAVGGGSANCRLLCGTGIGFTDM